MDDLRGNVPTRLRKLIANPWDAIILARAGLERLGFDCRHGTIGFEGTSAANLQFCRPNNLSRPAAKGIVALQIRSDDAESATHFRAD